MAEREKHFEGKQIRIIIFLLSIFSIAFTTAGLFLDVYHFRITGAVYEMLWLPMILCVFTLPVLTLFFLLRDGFDLRSLYFYALVISVANILMLIFLTEKIID